MYRYHGSGQAPPGIPARDIPEEEVKRRHLDREIIENARILADGEDKGPLFSGEAVDEGEDES